MINSIRLVQAVMVAASLVYMPVYAEIYKWTDAEGNVHYSERPPASGQVKELTVQPSPEYSPLNQSDSFSPAPAASADTHSEEPSAISAPTGYGLGPLPENSSSKYLETTSTGFLVQPRKRRVQYMVSLKAKTGLPFGAVLESRFENPADQNRPFTRTIRRSGGADTIRIESPFFSTIKCGNLLVEISIYRHSDKKQLLGVHRQYVQSRIDTEKARTLKEWIRASLSGNCPN